MLVLMKLDLWGFQLQTKKMSVFEDSWDLGEHPFYIWRLVEKEEDVNSHNENPKVPA